MTDELETRLKKCEDLLLKYEANNEKRIQDEIFIKIADVLHEHHIKHKNTNVQMSYEILLSPDQYDFVLKSDDFTEDLGFDFLTKKYDGNYHIDLTHYPKCIKRPVNIATVYIKNISVKTSSSSCDIM